MKAAISNDSARAFFNRMVSILSSADTWHGRAMEMRVLFDALLNEAAGFVKADGSFWKDAIDVLHPVGSPDPDDDYWRAELHEWRIWFNTLQHKNAGIRGAYTGYGRHTVLEVLRSMADYINAISGCPVDPLVLGACLEPSDSVRCGPNTVVMLCELCSALGAFTEGAKLVDALRDIPYKKQLHGMGSDVSIQSIIYTDPLLHFRDTLEPDKFEYVSPSPVDHAIRRAIGALKAGSGRRWLIWRTSNPAAASAEAMEALNAAIADLHITVVPLATTPEAEKQFRRMWRKVLIYSVTPMLPDNMINSVLSTIVRETITSE